MCYNVNKICKHSPPLSKKLSGKRTSKAKQNKRKINIRSPWNVYRFMQFSMAYDWKMIGVKTTTSVNMLSEIFNLHTFFPVGFLWLFFRNKNLTNLIERLLFQPIWLQYTQNLWKYMHMTMSHKEEGKKWKMKQRFWFRMFVIFNLNQQSF